MATNHSTTTALAAQAQDQASTADLALAQELAQKTLDELPTHTHKQQVEAIMIVYQVCPPDVKQQMYQKAMELKARREGES